MQFNGWSIFGAPRYPSHQEFQFRKSHPGAEANKIACLPIPCGVEWRTWCQLTHFPRRPPEPCCRHVEFRASQTFIFVHVQFFNGPGPRKICSFFNFLWMNKILTRRHFSTNKKVALTSADKRSCIVEAQSRLAKNGNAGRDVTKKKKNFAHTSIACWLRAIRFPDSSPVSVAE